MISSQLQTVLNLLINMGAIIKAENSLPENHVAARH